ncbi:acetyl-CoA C-acyltransferase [Ravibacter arvi]|uniref:acetyl-CoA C-acetyltransferase n=1 Tax=Ravibacter arvi TaxID=2051041 RepID=A0ABP8LMB9_9BACT
MIKDVFIASAVRTPVGSFGAGLSTLQATELGRIAVSGAVRASGIDPDAIDEAYLGNVVSANLGQAPARQAVRLAGLPEKVICTTVNKVCASGLKAVTLGAQAIQLGDASVVVAGGMESMSNTPFYIPKARFGYGYGNGQLIDGLVRDGLQDAYDQSAMGACGDATAARYKISREEQDAYAVRSYARAAEAWEKGLFNQEIVPVTVPQKKGSPLIVSRDEEFTRVKLEKIPTLSPAFSPEGTVTAANASTLNDGAAALVLAGTEQLEAAGKKPLARIVAYADAEQEPKWFTTTPVLATEKLLKKAGLKKNEIDFFEVNEAFSVVALAYINLLELDPDRVNVWGGAVALGHPLGASGARILTTLVNVLHARGGRYGIATICNGGGGATAVLVEV